VIVLQQEPLLNQWLSFFRIVITTGEKDTDKVMVFYRMVMPNVNVRRVDINHLTDIGAHNSITNAIMADSEALEYMLRNLAAKLSILTYKFTDDAKKNERLFSCMVLSFDNKYEPHVATYYYADDLSILKTNWMICNSTFKSIHLSI
jgi:hypothetical protein